MKRLSTLLAFLALAAPAMASAQSTGQPPLPLATDLAKVPVGRWAEYSMTAGPLPPQRARTALVARADRTNTLEMSVEGDRIAKMTIQTELESRPPKEPRPKKLVIQVGDTDPMLMPIEADEQAPFLVPDEKNLVGQETIATGAGRFKTKHYRQKGPAGDSLDFWVSEEVAPIGLVRLEGERKGIQQQQPIHFKIELVATGKNAKTTIVKAPKPFDEAKFMSQLQAAAVKANPKPSGAAPQPGASRAPK